MDAFSPSKNGELPIVCLIPNFKSDPPMHMGSMADIARAQKILDIMSSSERGAEGLVNEDGKEEMIDKPMILQVYFDHLAAMK